MKVNVITLHRVFNYGSVLQTYATQKSLEKLGYEVEVIDYITEVRTVKKIFLFYPESYKGSIIKKNIYILSRLIPNLLKYVSFKKFLSEHINLSKQKYINIDDLRNNPPNGDVYITGSDQVWNSDYNEMIDKGFFLDFGKEEVKRISYAASFGKSELAEWEKEETLKLLKKYDYIGVREQKAIEILEDLGIEKARLTLDPTLLLTRSDWCELINQGSKKKNTDKYVLLFLLYNEDNGATSYARKIADEKGIKVIQLCWKVKAPKDVDEIATYKNPIEFLQYMNDATYIVTNSFHGVAFAINLNKEFLVVPRKEYNSRLYNILEIAGLNNRIMNDQLDLKEALKEIEYRLVNDRIEKQRQISIDFLESAIKNKEI